MNREHSKKNLVEIEPATVNHKFATCHSAQKKKKKKNNVANIIHIVNTFQGVDNNRNNNIITNKQQQRVIYAPRKYKGPQCYNEYHIYNKAILL